MKIFIVIVCSVVAVLVIYLIIVNNILRKNKIEVSSPKVPESFDGYRIIFLSDLHDCSLEGFALKRLLSKVKKASPDVIFLGGDMHEKEKKDDVYFRLLKNLKETAPLYFVEGNHELLLRKRSDFSRYMTEFNKYVFNLNGQTELVKNGEKIKLYGCGYSEYEKDGISFDKRYFSVFLYHSPFVFDDFNFPPDLMVSGHVHGGIIELPFLGAVFSPGNGRGFFERFKPEFFFPKYYKNSYRREDSVLVVGRGIGNFKYCPLRIIPPEIVEITLMKK